MGKAGLPQSCVFGYHEEDICRKPSLVAKDGPAAERCIHLNKDAWLVQRRLLIFLSQRSH